MYYQYRIEQPGTESDDSNNITSILEMSEYDIICMTSEERSSLLDIKGKLEMIITMWTDRKVYKMSFVTSQL